MWVYDKLVDGGYMRLINDQLPVGRALHRHQGSGFEVRVRVPFRPFFRRRSSSITKLRKSLPMKLLPSSAVQMKFH